MLTRDNIADVIDAKAMMCVHGDAGVGKTFSVNASLRELAADTVCRVQFRARPTPRDIRHTLFDALGVAGVPPLRPIEFDQTLKNVLSERFRVLVCDEAQWMSRECFEYWRHLWDDRRTDITIVFVGGGGPSRVRALIGIGADSEFSDEVCLIGSEPGVGTIERAYAVRPDVTVGDAFLSLRYRIRDQRRRSPGRRRAGRRASGP